MTSVRTARAIYFQGSFTGHDPTHWSGPGGLQDIAGRVGSGRVGSGEEVSKSRGSGSVTLTRPDPRGFT